jgi:phage tail-like protein
MIDVNGTRFHLAVGEADWLPPGGTGSDVSNPGVEWTDGALQLRKIISLFPRRRTDRALDAATRRGAAKDRYGDWYWISDDAHEVRVSRAAQRSASHFWSADDAARAWRPSDSGSFTTCPPPSAIDPLELSGLAVTADHYLVVGQRRSQQRGGLLVFDLRGGGAPLALDWPADVAFTPFDISAARDGGVWILDRAALVLWRLDRYFRVVCAQPPAAAAGTAVFAPLSGTPDDAIPVCTASAISAGAALPLAGVAAPVAVEALPDGSALVLDNPPASDRSTVHRFRLDGSHFRVDLDEALDPDESLEDDDGGGHPLPLVGYDLAFVAAAGPVRPLTGTLYVAASASHQAFAFDFVSQEGGFALTLRRDNLPLSRFTGKALVATGGKVYYDFNERWLTLVEHPGTRYEREATVQLPTADLVAYDGKEPRCVWHRLLIDACVPPETEIVVKARSADDRQLLAFLPWRDQPALYRRGDGSELPYYTPPLKIASDRAATWELLFSDVVGRYLQIAVTLKGTGRTTPRLAALRAYYPRFSYLREYLPAVYREDAESASFLERYLANVEGIYTALEGRIEHVEQLFDTRTVPADYLDWLGGWLGASMDFAWRPATKRLFLSHAPQMFHERGTCAGLVRAIRLALNPSPPASLFGDSPCGSAASAGFDVRVVERFRTRRAAGVVFGDASDVVGPGSTAGASDWTPAQGAQPLHDLYRAFLRGRYDGIVLLNAAWGSSFKSFTDPTLRLPAVRPTRSAQATDWEGFVRYEIGFTYAVVLDADEPLYREFLARRYRQPADLNQEYQLDDATKLATWDDLQEKVWNARLRQAIPDSGPWLRDWIQFVSTVLPMDRSAHQFTVLVPVGLQDTPETQLTRQQLAERIADIQKPAHTAFDVKLYWGLFRVGEARTGLDTVLGEGSRSVALVLDRGAIGASHLGLVEPWNVGDRFVMGRDGAGSGDARSCGCGTSRPTGRSCGCGGHATTGGGCNCK